MSASRHGFLDRERQDLEFLLARALAEDLGQKGDITSCSMIPAAAQGAARLVARSPGVLAGLPAVELLARTFEPWFDWLPELADGDRVERGSVVGRLEGPMRSLLAIERTALNFVQHLSGIASLTARYVAAVDGTPAAILDTRKTTPGWRFLEKYAVRCGGGRNHRLGLDDGVLIKDNHLAWIEEAARDSGAQPFATAVVSAQGHAAVARPLRSRLIRSSSSTGRSRALPTSYSSTISNSRTLSRPSAGVMPPRP